MKIDPRNIEIADKTTIEIWKKIPGERRILMAFEMFETAAAIIRASVKEKHPDWSEAEIRKEIGRRMRYETD